MSSVEPLYGRQAVREALRARRRQHKRLCMATGQHESAILHEITILAQQQGIPMESTDRRTLDKRLNTTSHQGVLLETTAYPYVSLETCLEQAEQRNEPPLLLILDHLQDPQNIGSLLRTAEAIGIHGVLIPHRRAASITPAVVNASSGASEHLCVAMVANIAQHIVLLQQHQLQVIGIEQDPRAIPVFQIDLTQPLALVLGAEATGLARLTRDRCDRLVSLPMRGQIDSLNAAIAGSIVLYHAFQRRHLTAPVVDQIVEGK